MIFGFLLFASFLTVNAQTTTFAQFLENNGSQDFVFTNNGSSANFATIVNGSSVSFRYQNIAGLDSSLQGFQDAHLTISPVDSNTTIPAFDNSGTLTQPFQAFKVQIIRDLPTAPGVGTGTRRNLLTAVIQPIVDAPDLAGSGNSATFQATTPDHIVTFSSDFLVFAATTSRNMALSFSSVTPTLAINGNFLQSFTAAATGTFASNPPPTPYIPTAAPVSVGGRVLTSDGRGLRNAQVLLVEADGTVHRAMTSSFGYYHFEGISSGQNVTLSVVSKRYSYNPMVIALDDSLGDLDFYGNE
ncbi:MAG: carboxypeptidase regulatory-like domain-containing protein [Acidobacteria bacterium]|nr:carboxypeptidase regulatory-like domain-containing protein [Acidobacteriota bacterium]